jgi:maltose O-acetyltransferase
MHMALTEKEKMLAGELYRSNDPELQRSMALAQERLRALNAIPNEEPACRQASLHTLLGEVGDEVQLRSPFACDYGVNIRIGRNSFVNFGCIFLDCNLIIIGQDAQIGPGVHIYTALHPVDPKLRRSGLESARPVRIGRNVWIGGHTVLCPGVTIGDNTVIGAGSIVVRDIPEGKVAVGNPCRVIRDV